MKRCSLKWYSIIFFSVFHSAVAYGQVLDVPEVVQEQSEWCWAGVSSCVLNYYGKPVSQCTIVDFTRTKATWHDFGTENCCDAPNKKCNYWNYNYGYPGSIEEILKEWGVQNRGTDKSLTPEKIIAEVSAGRPFIIRWALKPSGGHFVVGHGIVDSMIYYMDPWRGEGYKIAKYSAVASNSSHTWQGTNVVTTNSGLMPVSLLSPADSARNQSRALTFIWYKVNTASYRFQCATTTLFTAPLVKDTAIAIDTTLRLTGLSPSTTYFWRVRATTATDTGVWSTARRFTTESATAVATNGRMVPATIRNRLSNNGLTITYTVPFASQVNIGIYTVGGELLQTVSSGFHHAGTYSKTVSRVSFAAGNYLLSIYTGNRRFTTLMFLEQGR
jgi:hypothetical protein